MPNFDDARIPVIFAPAAAAGAGDAVLVEGDAVVPAGLPVDRFAAGRPGHPTVCACCAPRGAVAVAMHRMFLARARGSIAFFGRLVVAAGPTGQAAVREALASDGFLIGRYRLEG